MLELRTYAMRKMYYIKIEIINFKTFFKKDKIIKMCFVCIFKLSNYLLSKTYKLHKSVSKATINN